MTQLPKQLEKLDECPYCTELCPVDEVWYHPNRKLPELEKYQWRRTCDSKIIRRHLGI